MKLIENFIKECEKKNLSELTIKNYKTDLNKFYKDLNISENDNNSLVTISEEDVKKYFEKLKEENTKENTMNRKISTLKAFYNFLKDKKVIKKNPVENLEFFKVEQNHKYLSNEDIEKIFNYLNKSIENATEKRLSVKIRDAFIMDLLLSTGLRVNEVSNLKLENFKEDKIILKDRIIRINNKISRLYKEWLYYRSEMMIRLQIETDYLFISQKCNKLSKRQIQNLCIYLSEKTGIEFSASMLRHSFVKNNIEVKNYEELGNNLGYSTKYILKNNYKII